jgi:glycosyltransferase involved in cell wall biosynthesis
MKMNKFIIILAYYNRPKLVLHALESIKNLDYDNYEVHFIDDGSTEKGEPVVREFCPEIIDKFKFYYIDNTPEDKVRQGGSIHGKYMNDIIKNNESDVIIILCDDDALFPNYLSNLNKFFNENPNTMWAYSHVNYYNPEKEHYRNGTFNPPVFNTSFPKLNIHSTPINPANNVDSTQVCFSRKAFVDGDIWYTYPKTKNLDSDIYNRMFTKWGLCPFTNFFSQYKAWFPSQLCWNTNKNI